MILVTDANGTNCRELIRQLSERGVSVRGWCVPSALIIAHEVYAYDEPALNSDRVGAEYRPSQHNSQSLRRFHLLRSRNPEMTPTARRSEYR